GSHASVSLSAIPNLETSRLYLHVFEKYSEICKRDAARNSVKAFRDSFLVISRAQDAQLYLDVYKRKSVTGGPIDVFEAYDVLCSRNVRRRHSVGSSHSSDAFQRYDELCATRSLSALYESVSGTCHGNSRPVSVGSVLRQTKDAAINASPISNHGKRTVADIQLTPVVNVATVSKRSRYSVVNNVFPFNECLDKIPSMRSPVDPGASPSQPSSVRPRANNRASSSAGHTGPRYTYAYNQMFTMTSFGVKIDESINAGRGPYVFKVSSQIYHWIGSLCPPVGEAPRFMQLYIYDTDNDVENRMRHFGGADNRHLDTGMVEGLIHFLDAHNELIQLFRTTREKCRQMDIPDFKIRLYKAEGARGYELPASSTLGAMVFKNDITTNKDFDVITEHKDGPPQRINKLRRSYMSLQFPLLFVYGQPGYHTKLKLRKADGGGSAKRMTMLAYYRGPRYMYAHYLDALAICRELGNPQFFITLTCNVNWPKTKKFMAQYPELTPSDRVDVVCWVFEQRTQAFVAFLKEQQPFGNVTGVIYTVEFQKRGLPHCHTLLWVDSASKIQAAEDVDMFISTEILDHQIDQDGYNAVSEFMMHGPCGSANSKAVCMKHDKCSKKFPKKFNSMTFFDDKGHVHYQRRDTAHINVEYCGWSMLIKYLFKYISKGMDMIFACVSKPIGSSSTEVGPSRQMVDEIENYVEGRFVAACEALGLLGNDREWEIALEEACGSASLEQLRYVFCHILLHCEVTDPSKHWFKYWREMGHDISTRVSQTVQIPDYHLNDDSLQGYILYELEVILSNYGKSLQDFGLAQPPENLLSQLSNRLLMVERNYDVDALKNEMDDTLPKLNVQHKTIYDLIINHLTIIGKIVLAVASSGIASLLLPSGRTTHSRIKLSLELTEESLCKVTKNSQLGNLLADTNLIIKDEAPMNDRHYFEALDRTLRDIHGQPSSLFGGKSILLGGDFQQTLPVKKGASKMEIIASCISESHLWSSFKIFKLKENMRLARPGISLEERIMVNSFASWLLDIGDENVGQVDEDDENTHTVDSNTSTKGDCCPKNETADLINSKVIEMVTDESTSYISQDEAIPTKSNGVETKMLYPVEHLNTLKLPGFPPHHLELKVGALVMLLRNMNLVGGL
nr:DNA helicase [Tanacetum cinerariifolium]